MRGPKTWGRYVLQSSLHRSLDDASSRGARRWGSTFCREGVTPFTCRTPPGPEGSNGRQDVGAHGVNGVEKRPVGRRGLEDIPTPGKPCTPLFFIYLKFYFLNILINKNLNMRENNAYWCNI
ncbi:protein of unknown function [Methanocaldococcus lauensis]|nr:protein of unknown function [Methanocaldococcus lauensis]